MFVDVRRQKCEPKLCQNCVTCPPQPWGNTLIYEDTSRHNVVAGSC
jgi:hypothetical protein